VRVPVPRSLYAYDDAPTPLAARNELRTLKASIPAQSDDIARFKLEDAHGAARLHVREHPLWGAKTHGLSHVRSIKEIFRTKRYARCSTSIALLSQLTAHMRRYRHVAPIAPRQSDRPRPARTQPAGALDRTQGYSGEPVNHQTSDALVAIWLHDARETETFPVLPAGSSRRASSSATRRSRRSIRTAPTDRFGQERVGERRPRRARRAPRKRRLLLSTKEGHSRRPLSWRSRLPRPARSSHATFVAPIGGVFRRPALGESRGGIDARPVVEADYPFRPLAAADYTIALA